ncbi:hypothetical protein [Chroococcidiopsis sp. CCMEE 29]|uniref:hypothetical protein n=1 Tax=Chroococcidiopsis sp. CCMEE 29 TaxID=155894 RepID=UPI00202225DA|nr:hypothetical protein [Chroococcidiopsis sp. CCMEE 29]
MNNTVAQGVNQLIDPVRDKFREHEWWDKAQGGKNLLNNLGLVIQPVTFFKLMKPWLIGLPISHLAIGFLTLIALMNRSKAPFPPPQNTRISYFPLPKVMKKR